MPQPPSRGVLLIIADDWSPIAGCYGNSLVQTPRIDDLARRATVFDHAFCTTPSCAASRANLLTGLYAHTHGQYGHSHGIHGFRTHEWVRSLPAILRDAGIRSGCIGKQHFAPLSVYPFSHFDAAQDEPLGSFSARRLTHAVDQFLRETGRDRFYLHVAPGYPHRVGQGWGLERCAEEFPNFVYDPAAIPVPDFLPDLPEVRHDLAGYYAAVSRYDHCVKEVLDALHRSGRAEDTLVIVLSDHGMPFPGAKASSFDSGHHCPLLILNPAHPSGSRSPALVNWCDIMPTTLEALGVARELWPKDLPGRSLLSILDNANAPGFDETFFSHCFHEVTNYFPYRAIRTARYKFVQHLASELPQPIPQDLFRSPTWTAVRRKQATPLGLRPTSRFLHRDHEELLDVHADPTESRNLINDPALKATADNLRGRLMDFRAATRDPWLENDFQHGTLPANLLPRFRPTWLPPAPRARAASSPAQSLPAP